MPQTPFEASPERQNAPSSRVEDDGLTREANDRLAQSILRRQAQLSVRVAAVFLLLVFGLPLVNLYLPQVANAPIFGFTATWLFLGVLFFPLTWLLSAYFIRHSDCIEADIAAQYRDTQRTDTGSGSRSDGATSGGTR